MAPAVLVPLALALMAAPVAVLCGAARPTLTAPVGAAFAAAAFAATLVVWISGGGAVDAAWAPTLGARFHVELDGLAALYSLLATGIGFAVLVYASRYLPLHIEEEREEGGTTEHGLNFYFFILLFMGSMTGLAMSQDLILIFLFWDITAISSYFLIGFDRHRRESRRSALMALLVTIGTAILLLAGAVVFYVAYGTFSVPELAEATEPGPLLVIAGGMIAIAGLSKSAQVPFQFWLPRAMAAPTPVSAYLHSAAMVAAGVLLIGRVYPLLQKSDFLTDALVVVGVASIGVGGILALTRDVMKQLLAYSTISQYGYVVFMFGLGGKYGAVGASFYVIAHALAKSALFLTAGAVTEATHETRLSRLGGLARPMPLLAAGSGAAAAGLAALPLTIGFFKDELLFGAALERGPVFVALGLAATVLTLAYTWRFWSGVFLGEMTGETEDGFGHDSPAVEKVPRLLVWPVVVLGALVVLGGLAVEPFAELGKAAGAASYTGSLEGVDPAYHLDARPENLLALATFVLGAAVVLSRPVWGGAAELFSRAGELFGPERAYRVGLRGLNRLSDMAHQFEVRDLRVRVTAILVPAGVLMALGLLVAPVEGSAFSVEGVRAGDVPLIIALAAAAGASLGLVFVRNHITIALVVSSAGFSIAVAFSLLGAPDVALVAVLVETIVTLILLGMLRLMPRRVLQRGARLAVGYPRLKAMVGVVAGVFALVLTWGALSQSPVGEPAVRGLIQLAPGAHAKDVVTVILADFRALDTMGEITVVALVLLGVATLIGRGRLP